MSAALALLLLAQAAPAPATPAPAPAPGVRWERIAGDAASTVFLDPASLRREGDTAWAVWRTEYARSNSADGMRALVILVAIDCRARSFSFRRIEGFREDGTPLQRFELAAGDPQARAYPFTAGNAEHDALYARSCGAGSAR